MERIAYAVQIRFTGKYAPLSSSELRDRFKALNESIASLPASPALLDSIAHSTARLVGKVAPLNLKDSDPPTRREVEIIVQKLNDLIEALKHP
jgi:hypothetical protein